ncbi:hypothetical protein BDZ89DRAFT_87540 [Hymenopellis radicata]|nr:hypothetical protein BDZ89DRAFT_87540 [Hymenopellis radicata]
MPIVLSSIHLICVIIAFTLFLHSLSHCSPITSERSRSNYGCQSARILAIPFWGSGYRIVNDHARMWRPVENSGDCEFERPDLQGSLARYSKAEKVLWRGFGARLQWNEQCTRCI